jgi:hypothetical protein
MKKLFAATAIAAATLSVVGFQAAIAEECPEGTIVHGHLNLVVNGGQQLPAEFQHICLSPAAPALPALP